MRTAHSCGLRQILPSRETRCIENELDGPTWQVVLRAAGLRGGAEWDHAFHLSSWAYLVEAGAALGADSSDVVQERAGSAQALAKRV